MAKQTRRRSHGTSNPSKGKAPEKASSERSDSGNSGSNADVDAGPSPQQSGFPVPHATPAHTPTARQPSPSGSLQHILDGSCNSDASSSTGLSSRRTSSFKQESAKPTADNASPRSNTVDVHSTPSSPEPALCQTLRQRVASF